MMQYDTSENAGSFISPGDYIAVIKRRRAVMGAAFATVLVAGTVATLLTKPVYRATTRLLIDRTPSNGTPADASNPYQEAVTNNQQFTLETQIALLQGEDMQRRAASALGGTLKMPGAAITVGKQSFAVAVTNPKDTQILEIAAEGPNAARTAAVADSVANSYLKYLEALQNGRLHEARKLTAAKVIKSRSDLQAAEHALARFQNSHGLADLDKDRDSQIAALSALQAQFQTTVAQLARAKAEVAETQTEMKAEPRTESGVLSPAADPLIQQAETQIATLASQRAGLATQYAPKSERIGAINAQIAVLQRRLANLRQSVPVRNTQRNAAFRTLQARLNQSQVEAAGLTSQVAAVTTQLNKAQVRLGTFAGTAMAVAPLERQVSIAKAAYVALVQKDQDLSLREQMADVSAHLAASASVPETPERPKKAQGILLTALLALFCAVCSGLLLEFMDDRIHSATDADRLLRLRVVGRVAAAQSGLDVSMRSALPIPDAYRELRTTLNLLEIDTPLHTIAITSANPGAGSSAAVAHLAHAFAVGGKRVLVVDANLRRSSQDGISHAAAIPGLVDVLEGNATLAEAVLQTAVENVTVLTAGSPTNNPAELLESPEMEHLLKSAQGRADIVLLDLPAVLDAPDARVIAAQIDGTLLLVNGGDTRKPDAERSRELLSNIRIRLLGIVWVQAEQGASGKLAATIGSKAKSSHLPAAVVLSAGSKMHDIPRSMTHPRRIAVRSNRTEPEEDNIHA